MTPMIEETTYPACETRLVGTVKGVVAHVKCANPSRDHYMRLVQPVDCRRCLGLEHEDAPMSTVVAEQDSKDKDVPPAPPSLARRVVSYAEALAEWAAAGRPERSDKDVEQIFHRFCKPCRWFDRRRHICRGCGCRLADSGFAVFNKIKMATEHCPRNLW